MFNEDRVSVFTRRKGSRDLLHNMHIVNANNVQKDNMRNKKGPPEIATLKKDPKFINFGL